jgi:branched-chain amino acid transport system permease protein
VLGCLVAVPVLRLRGIYLALSTLAFAILMDGLVFGNSRLLGGGGTLAVPRPSIIGVDVQSERAMFILAAAAASLFAVVFLAVRRSSLGRLLNALRDSPTAVQMMGVSLARLKLAVFGLSALLAGAAGALLGALQVRVGALDFLYFRSLTVVLVATIFGITSVSGALLGAAFFVVLPEALRGLGSEGGGGFGGAEALQPLIIGGLAMAAARHPEGISGQLRAWARRQLGRLRPAGPDPEAEPEPEPEATVAVAHA